jgi:hypothetical protein
MRWALVCLVLSCAENEQPISGQSCVATLFASVPQWDELDVLFVVDDSLAMVPFDGSLAQNAAQFAGILRDVGSRVPELHVAVVAGSSSGAFFDPGTCGLSDSLHYIHLRSDGRDVNVADLDASLLCLLRVPMAGASPQQPIAAAWEALARPDQLSFRNTAAGFLLVFITPQDDQSPDDVSDYLDVLHPPRSFVSVVGRRPEPRLDDLLSLWGGQFVPIEQADWTDAFWILRRSGGPPLPLCLEGSLAIGEPDAGSVIDPKRVHCSFRRVQFLETSSPHEIAPMPPCDPSGQSWGPCWALLRGDKCISNTYVVFCYDGFDPGSVPPSCLAGPAVGAPDETVVGECGVACE